MGNNKEYADYDFLPLNCSTSVDSVLQEIGAFSEVTDTYICMYEALWTATHETEILRREKVNGYKVWVKNDRKKAIIDDLYKEPEHIKNIIVSGDYYALKFHLERRPEWQGIQFSFWNELKPGWELEAGKDKLIVMWDAHCVFANLEKVDKRLLAMREKSKSTKEHLYKLHVNEKRRKELLKMDSFELSKPVHDLFLDIETYIDKATGKMMPYLIVVLEDGIDHVFWGVDDCVSQFTEWLRNKVSYLDEVTLRHTAKEDKLAMWTYNGNRFDLIYLLEPMIEFPDFHLVGSFKTVKMLRIGNMNFYDLLRICPFGSLNKTAQFWNIGMEKFEMDHDKITKQYLLEDEENGGAEKERIIKYCIQDCNILRECVKKYKTHIMTKLKISPYVLSTAALSIKYYQTFFAPASNKAIRGISESLYPIMKSSYKGGICQVIRKRPNPGEVIYEYDINSSYPAIMRDYPIPYEYTGKEEFKPVRDIRGLCYDWIQDAALYGVNDLEWSEQAKYPTLPVRTNMGLRYIRRLKGLYWIWGIELKFALKTGYVAQGKIHVVHYFKTGLIFHKYIDTLYKQRMAARARGDKISEQFDKLTMNNCYGKLAQEIFNTKQVVSARQLMFWIEADKNIQMIKNIDKITDNIYEITMNSNQYDQQIGGCVFVSAFITAAARTRLWEGVKDVTSNFTENTVFYMDTDSIFTSKPMSPQFIDNNKLGYFKLEFVVKDAIFCAPKVYWLQKENGEEVKKFKGLLNSALTKEHYQQLLEEKTLTITSGFVFNRKIGSVYKKDNTKSMFIIDKRNFPSLYESYPYID